MKILKTFLIGSLLSLALYFPFSVFAQSPEYTPLLEEFYQATVLEILDQGEKDIAGMKNPYQTVRLHLEETGEEVVLEHGGMFSVAASQMVGVGDKVVLLKIPANPEGKDYYQIIDKYRLNKLIILMVIFFVLILVISRWKGLGSIAGLVISFAVIIGFIVPQILSGKDPVLISIAGSLFIMTTTLYLAHGFTKKTTVALVSTFIALVLVALLSSLFVELSFLGGLGSEDAYSLRFGSAGFLNLKGLLLGGIIIGALGVLDDITTSQSAAVFELSKANQSLSLWELVSRGMNIGREHISSLVNTLVLAYAGASLPLFLFFVLNANRQPIWVLLNSEFVAEEIVRTLTGSIGLILAVPIVTFLAAWVNTRRIAKKAA